MNSEIENKNFLKQNTSPRNYLSNSYKFWFNEELKKWHLFNVSSYYPNFKDWAQNCCFFFTMTFSERAIKRLQENQSLSNARFDIEWDNFHHCYLFVVRKLYGRHYSRPHFASRSPFVIAAIDFNGSRYASSSTLSRKNAHIHAIWAVHPDDLQAFQKIIDGYKFRLQFLNRLYADAVKFDPFTLEKGSLSSAGSYVIKSHVKGFDSPSGAHLLRIYPHCNFNQNGVTYRASRTYPKRNAMLEKLRRAALGEVRS